MSWSTVVLTALGLLVVGLFQAAWTLIFSPRLFHRNKDSISLNDRIDAKSRRDKIAASVFLLLTALFSIWNIRDSAMNEPASKKEFTDLAARVTKLENDRPPGTNAEIDKRLASLEQSLSSASQQAKGLATREDLKKTRKELEETIEKIVAEVQKLRTALQQRGQAQGG